MRRIVCTTGTSLLTNAQRSLKTDAERGSPSTLMRRYYETLRANEPSQGSFLIRLCAETNSLHRLGLNKSDEVVLLHTETSNGRECAEMVRDILREELGVNAQVREVKGVQVEDADRFRKIGLHELFKILRTECVEWQEDGSGDKEVILNATGGFKAVVPYLTLFGLIHRLKVVYIFEQSNQLIWLPPLPIHFDYERLGQARPALQLLKREGVLPKEKFFEEMRGLPYHERPWYESLLEEDASGNVTLSSFGFLIVEAWEKDTKQIYLSPEAQETYDKGQGQVRKRVDHFLTLLQDPLWRKSHKHEFTGTDLEVYKMPHQAERVAGFVRGNRLYVALIYLSHDQYERDLPKRRLAEFEDRAREFRPWTPPAEDHVPPTETPDEYQRLVEENERLSKRIADLERQVGMTEEARRAIEELCADYERSQTAAMAENAALQDRLSALEHQLRQAEDICQTLRLEREHLAGQNHEREKEIQELRRSLAWARRSWWRKFLGLPPVNEPLCNS